MLQTFMNEQPTTEKLSEKEKRAAWNKAWREANKEHLKEYYIANKEKIRSDRKAAYQANKEQALARGRAYYQANKGAIKEYAKEHYKNNIDMYRGYSKKYCTRDKHKRIAYHTRKLKEDPLFACKVKLSGSIRNSAKRSHQQLPFKTIYGIKQSDLEKVLGCTIHQFVTYFDSLFQPGMNWSNHGKWHIDHIKPVATATTVEEVVELNHYTNLQPLWATDNMTKGSMFEGVRVRRAL